MYAKITLLACAPLLLFGCGTAPQKPAPTEPPAPTATANPPAPVNDFPTQARVEYVLQCMDRHGKENYDTLYSCVCAADRLASKMSYDEYSEALPFLYLKSMAGEAGGMFRDSGRGDELRDKLEEAQKYAETCFSR